MHSRRHITVPDPNAAGPNLLPGTACWRSTRLTITAAEGGGPPAHLTWLRQPSAWACRLTSRRHSAAASCCRPFPAHAGWCMLGSTGSQDGTRRLLWPPAAEAHQCQGTMGLHTVNSVPAHLQCSDHMEARHHSLEKEPTLAPCTATLQQCHNAVGSCSVTLQGGSQSRLADVETDTGFLHSLDWPAWTNKSRTPSQSLARVWLKQPQPDASASNLSDPPLQCSASRDRLCCSPSAYLTGVSLPVRRSQNPSTDSIQCYLE